MKRIFFIGFTTAAMSFASMSHANFNFHSNAPNACDSMAGLWAGTGSAKNWLIGECIYNGSGSSSAVDNTGKFTIQAIADKVSGSFICPSHADKQLTGVCVNGDVTVLTEYGNLIGSFTKNSGEAKGTLYVAGTSTDVTLQFQRVG